ncbi:MAG: hypothetical protein QM820_03595 [Minicystis sp.]
MARFTIASTTGRGARRSSSMANTGAAQAKRRAASTRAVTPFDVCSVSQSASAPPTPHPPRLPAIDQPAAAPLRSTGTVVAMSASTAADEVAAPTLAMKRSAV